MPGGTYTITLSSSPISGGLVSGDGSFPQYGDQTVTAVANAGYTFVNWTDGGVEVSTSASYTFNLSADTTLVANFVATVINYTITLSSSPISGGLVSGDGTFVAGTSQTVTTTANSGYTFVNWTDGGVEVSTSTSYTFTLSTNTTLVANFIVTVINYTITLSSSPVAGGTVSGDGTFVAGTSQTVVASANPGYTFVNWTNGGTVVSTSDNYTFTLSTNTTLVANFSVIVITSTNLLVQIKNENYGYAVATYGDYVVSGNPAIIRYNPLTASVFYTGSVDLFRYNRNTDEHDYITTLYKYVNLDVLLARESDRKALQTEDTGSVPRTNDKGLLIDKNLYTFIAEDGFGLSLDMYKKLLVVGSPYYSQSVDTYAYHATVSGSAVDIFDLANTEFVSSTSSIFIYTIEDPDSFLPTAVTSSFGYSVSINENWIAVGSPYVSSSNGMVYIYKNQSTGSNFSWSLYQKIEASGSIAGAEFGYDLKLNKYTGAHSASMVIGCGNSLNGQAYYFELTNSIWTQTFVFVPDYTIQPMTFNNYLPYTPTMNITNGFGKAVSIYGDSVIIGEYLDRSFYEYSGSSLYQQGSVYIFERCNNQPYTLFQQVFKSYGNTSSLKNNDAGFSVDIFGNNALAGIPKTNVLTIDSCYVAGTLEQLHYCNSDLEHLLLGQAMFIQKNTSSNNWEITNIYQRKKKFLSPYRSYGFDVAIADKSMVVSAPMYLYDSNRQINIAITQSNDVELDDIMGKSYIYNLKNLRNEFHVGNVFYRNGKIIIMTSGSIFDGLFFNPVNTSTYEYDLQFKGQHTIFEKQIICSVNPGEFNVSTNPTAIITNTSSLDINKNGKMDFQDLDVVLRYMQYKNTSLLGTTVSTDWSSSIVNTDDEISLLNYYQENTDDTNTALLASESIVRWETTDIWMQDVLDLNDDNKIDIRDMNIMWKYFTNRLTQKNYATYITPACSRKLFSNIIDYMDVLTQKNAKPLINPLFFDYEYNVANDKTGSFLAPYVTTIGLYADTGDLVCTAKLGTPIKIIPELPYNFIIKIDF